MNCLFWKTIYFNYYFNEFREPPILSVSSHSGSKLDSTELSNSLVVNSLWRRTLPNWFSTDTRILFLNWANVYRPGLSLPWTNSLGFTKYDTAIHTTVLFRLLLTPNFIPPCSATIPIHTMECSMSLPEQITLAKWVRWTCGTTHHKPSMYFMRILWMKFRIFLNTFSSAFVLKAFMNPIVEWSMDLLVRLGHLVVIKQTFPCTSRISAGSCWFFTMSCRFLWCETNCIIIFFLADPLR